MAKARKLPSGSWRCLVFSHFEPVIDKKTLLPVIDPKTQKQKMRRVYESFTSDDPSPAGRRAAELAAAEFASRKKTLIPSSSNMIFRSAIEEYCNIKSNVLSPSTLREYRRLAKTAYKDLEDIPIRKLNNECIQRWVNIYASTHSPKSTKNAYGLISAVLDMFLPDLHLKITTPKKEKPILYVPTDDNIKTILAYLNENDKEMEIAVLLAAFGPLRRSEICALTTKDIHENIISINKAMIEDEFGNWVIKNTPKTYSGYRDIEFPSFVIDRLSARTGKIIQISPNTITLRFSKLLKRLHIPHFRFHDLRHYTASIMHAIGIPDQYIMQRGGWSSETSMNIYKNRISSEQEKFNFKILNHFELMQHEMQHKK